MSAELYAALSKAQAEFPPIERSKTVKVQTKTGGSYSFDYAPLDTILTAIRPILAKHGLSVSQLLTEATNGGPALLTILGHSSGSCLEGTVPLPATAGMSAQEFGSLVTYYRRYGIVSALGIATEEDDDGNHASGNTTQPAARTKAAQTSGAANAASADKAPPSTDSGIPFGDPDEKQETFVPPPTDGITASQLKFLRALAEKLIKAEALTVEAFRAELDASFGVTSTKALTKEQASGEIESLKKRAIDAGLIEG